MPVIMSFLKVDFSKNKNFYSLIEPPANHHEFIPNPVSLMRPTIVMTGGGPNPLSVMSTLIERARPRGTPTMESSAIPLKKRFVVINIEPESKRY